MTRKRDWPQSHRDTERLEKAGSPLRQFAASAAFEFSRGFSTHGKLGFLFLVASATIEFSRRYATKKRTESQRFFVIAQPPSRRLSRRAFRPAIYRW